MHYWQLLLVVCFDSYSLGTMRGKKQILCVRASERGFGLTFPYT